MSKIDQTYWQNPYTQHGLRLPAEQIGDAWRIHEAGAMALPANWLFRQVYSPFWRLFLGFTPGVWVSCDGIRYESDPSQLLVMPAGVPFDCGSAPRTRQLWLHFSQYSTLPTLKPRVLQVKIDRTMRAVAMALRQSIKQRDSHQALHLGSALLHVVFARLEQDVLQKPEARLRQILSWLEHHKGETISNCELAAQAGLSVEQFIRWFKTRTGRTPAAYVAEWRVREACRQLAYGEDSIDQIAESLGFSNRHHFSRVFKQYAGCGPATFRRGRHNG